MAILTKAQLEAENQSSFPDNSTEAITPAILRAYNTDVIDTLVDSLATGSFVSDTTFNTFTESVDNKFDTIAAQSASWNAGGVGVATTGSNTFRGDQTIESDGPLNGIFFKTGSSEFFVGQRSNGNFSISSSAESRIIDINPSSGWLEVYSPQTNFNNQVSFRGTIDARNINTTTGLGFVAQFDGFTASLQEGYAWVGKSGGTSIAVPTSSFGGGGSATWPVSGTPSGIVSGSSQLTASYDQRYALSGSGGGTINTGSFATTGSNIFNGSQTITGSLGVSSNITASGEIRTDSRMYVFNQYGGIDIQENAQGSGSQYPGMSMKVAPNTYPTDIFGGFTVLTEQGAIAGTTFLGLVANSYSTQYSGTTTPMIIANGNNPAGNDTAIAWTSNGQADHWKKSNFKYGIDVTGSLNASGGITGSIRATNGVISGSSQISGLGYATTGSNTFNGSQTISGSVRVTGSVIGSKVGAFDFDTLFLGTQMGGTTANGTFFGYGSTNYEFIVGAYAGGFDSELKITADNTGIAFGDFNGSSYPTWLRLNPNTGANPAPIFTRGVVVSGSLSVSGSQTINSSTTTGLTINNGGITASGRIKSAGGLETTGSFNALIPTASSESLVNLFRLPTFVGANGTTYSTANISLQDYASSGIDQQFVIEYANDSYEKYSGLAVGPTTGGSVAKFILNTGTGYDFDEISITDNGNNTSTALIKSDTNRLQGNTQVTGSLSVASGSGDFYIYGHKQFNYGAFQTNIAKSGSANVSQSISFEITDTASGVSMVSGSRMTFANAGVYSTTFSAQIEANAGADTVWIWLKKNGVNVAESATKAILPNNTAQTMTVNFVNELNAGDYLEIVWQNLNGTGVLLAENASGNIPAIPSVILTSTQVR